jgi:hypothetical protein
MYLSMRLMFSPSDGHSQPPQPPHLQPMTTSTSRNGACWPNGAKSASGSREAQVLKYPPALEPNSLLILTFLRSPRLMDLGISLDRLHCTARCGQGLSVLRGPQRGNFCLSFLFIDPVA